MAGFLKPEDTPRALQVDEVLEQITKDDQEEWEYEYSSTETEVGGPSFPFNCHVCQLSAHTRYST
jgi:hypothetical protein